MLLSPSAKRRSLLAVARRFLADQVLGHPGLPRTKR